MEPNDTVTERNHSDATRIQFQTRQEFRPRIPFENHKNPNNKQSKYTP